MFDANDPASEAGSSPEPAPPPDHISDSPAEPRVRSLFEREDATLRPEPEAVDPEPLAPPREGALGSGSYFRPAEPVDEEAFAVDLGAPLPTADLYADIPASLELDYSSSDIGLSPRAYDRAIPYERVERRRNGARTRKVARELVETVVLALLIFFAVRAVVQNFRVEGASMEPSMHNNQYLLVNKALYYRLDLGRLHDVLPFLPGDTDGERHLFRPPNRGDIVVFRFPLDPKRDFIKRVIGIPGDSVEIRDEKVFVNGTALVENYILATSNYMYGPKTVPPGRYFVLGDNRRNSYDSHAWGSSCGTVDQCEFVPEENIIGQAWITYWPFDELGLINNKDIQAP
jgi:signal peptidase I